MGKSELIKLAGLKTGMPMEIEELARLHTGSLLSRLQKLRSLDEDFARGDWSAEEKRAAEGAGLILFKDSELWRTAYADVKTVLASREHLLKNKRPR